MKWLRRKPTLSTCALYVRGVLTYDGPCVCDIFDIGPRCGACVASCAAKGHPLGTHMSGHSDFCFCGAPDGRDDPPMDGLNFGEASA